MSKYDDEEFEFICPKCKEECYVIDDALQIHNLKKGLAYQLVHCRKCCTYAKLVWKFVKTIPLKEDN